MANEFEDFIKLELPLRPVLQADGNEETILVRRGQGPRIFELITLNEGEVLGKFGGVLTGGNVSGGTPEVRYTGTILVGETKEIARLPVADYKSVLFIVNLDSTTNESESYQVFCKPVSGDVDYTEYANLGDSINSEAEAILDGTDIVFQITNGWTSDVTYDVSKKN